jgi:hypothetical protein
MPKRQDRAKKVSVKRVNAMTPEEIGDANDPNWQLSFSVQSRLGNFLRTTRTLDGTDPATRYLKDIADGLEAQYPEPAGWIAEVRLQTHRGTHLQRYQVNVLKGDEPGRVMYANPTTMSDGGRALLEAMQCDMPAMVTTREGHAGG